MGKFPFLEDLELTFIVSTLEIHIYHRDVEDYERWDFTHQMLSFWEYTGWSSEDLWILKSFRMVWEWSGGWWSFIILSNGKVGLEASTCHSIYSFNICALLQDAVLNRSNYERLSSVADLHLFIPGIWFMLTSPACGAYS